MNYTFYYFAILSIFVNLYLKIINANPPKNEAGTSDGQSVNLLADQMDKVLKKREYTDVEFLVGNEGKKEIVSAHRAILSSASDVFEAMFRHDKGQIDIPDIEIGAFKTMLTFIYSKHFNGLDDNNLLDVLKAADKYNITGLVKECANFPIEKLPNVFVAFEQALSLNMEEFALRCLRYIDQNMSALIKSEAFLQIGQDLLCKILERDQLRSSEIEIWNAALRWSDEQCRQNGIECSAENRRKMLGPILFNIRFPQIPKEDFTKISTDVLTREERFGVFQHYFDLKLSDAPGLFPLKFPTQQRYKYEDTIEMEIEKVSEFAGEDVRSYRFSDAVDIGGFSWKILAQIKRKNVNNEKWLGFYLLCDASKEDGNWSRESSATLRIVSQKNGTDDLIGEFNARFNKKSKGWGFSNFICFEELMDPSRGFYNKDEDKVKLAIDVIVEEPKTDKFFSDPNKSNGTFLLEIEKISEFEREIIESERNSETVYIKGMPWKMSAEIETKNESTEKWLGFYLWCNSSEEENWSRECSSATFRIVSHRDGLGDFMREFSETKVFDNNTLSHSWNNLISFEELMDPSKGLYNKDEDKVTLAIDVSFA